MAQQFGDGLSPSHHEPWGERMPETVPSEVAQTRLGHGILKPMLVTLQRLSMHVNKNSTFASGSPKQLIEGRACQGVEWDVALIPFLRFGNVTSFRTRSTLSHVRPDCSLGLMPGCNAI
jgi:hypothetical protein